MSIESPGASGGCRGSSTRGSAIIYGPVACPLRPRNIERSICRPLLFVIPASLLVSDSRTSIWRAVLPDRPLKRGENGCSRTEDLVECWWNLGGRWVEPKGVAGGRLRA